MCDDHSGVLVEIPGAKPRGHLGTKRAIDACIAPLVERLNQAGLSTIASCCGHNKRPASIVLEDGRELVIARNWEEGRRIDTLFPGISYDPARPRVGLSEIDEQRAKGWPDFHPEDFCHRCGNRNVSSWYAPGELWNAVMGGVADEWNGIVCPPCFTELAAVKGVHTGTWKLVPETWEPTPRAKPGGDA